MSFERIPQELREVRQWHCWRMGKNKDGEDVKFPVQVDGSSAKSNDSSTWTDFESAESVAGFYSGLAFEITAPWTGIDLDNCLDENGIKPWAIEILFRFDGISFAEVSPSGTGIKILTRARKPPGSRCLHKIGPNKQQIECYDATRFWTITGELYNGQDEIRDGQDAVNWLCEKFLSKEKKSAEAPASGSVSIVGRPVWDPRA
jgi:putative DNA primase/helicase